MKWFEVHKEFTAGSDAEAPGSGYRAIAKIADEAMNGQAMVQFVRDAFPNQKSFGEYLGVGESTVAGWMKNGAFPDYAKRATLAAYYSDKYFRKLKDAKRDATQPKIVKDRDRYMIVRFKIDEAGVAIGDVMARDIPTEKTALVFAGGIRAWELLREAEHLIDDELESRDPEHSAGIQDLKDEIRLERDRTFNHGKLLEIERDRSEFIQNFELDDLVLPEGTAKTTNDSNTEAEANDD